MKIHFLLFSLAGVLVLSSCQAFPSEITEPETSSSSLDASQVEASRLTVVPSETEPVSAEDVYEDFEQESYESMLGQEPFALFFHAAWCPTCQFMEKEILENISGFPEGAKILKVDYDTETALKEKYGISSQSLVVMIDANGMVSETLVAPSVTSLQDSFKKLLQ